MMHVGDVRWQRQLRRPEFKRDLLVRSRGLPDIFDALMRREGFVALLGFGLTPPRYVTPTCVARVRSLSWGS